MSIGCWKCQVNCEDKKQCEPFKGKLRPYDGIRTTADGFDCALHVSLDSHSVCAFRCQYCFSNYLMRDPSRKAAYCGGVKGAYKVGQWPLRNLEKFLSGESEVTKVRTMYESLFTASGTGLRAPVQVGALGDCFDSIERWQEWSLGALALFAKYKQPARWSTKGGVVLQHPKYLKGFQIAPELNWVAFSIITSDDEMLERIDKDAPNCTERLKAMRLLSRMGVKTSLRFRPILPGISDSTARVPSTWRDLVRKSADAGACAISMEIAFVPGAQPPHVKAMWEEIERITGLPLVAFYKETSKPWGSCLRSSAWWKEDIVFAIREEAKACGMTFGISDPHWKELNDTGCCCGIKEDDPVFGGWWRKNATEALVQARRAYEAGKPILVGADDGIPDWAGKMALRDMVCLAGPQHIVEQYEHTWEDKLLKTWNDLKGARGPLHYFEGVLRPKKRDAKGNVLYEYVPRERRNPAMKKPPFWRI